MRSKDTVALVRIVALAENVVFGVEKIRAQIPLGRI